MVQTGKGLFNGMIVVWMPALSKACSCEGSRESMHVRQEQEADAAVGNNWQGTIFCSTARGDSRTEVQADKHRAALSQKGQAILCHSFPEAGCLPRHLHRRICQPWGHRLLPHLPMLLPACSGVKALQ